MERPSLDARIALPCISSFRKRKNSETDIPSISLFF